MMVANPEPIRPPYAWRQLTELVIKAANIKAVYDEADDVYRMLDPDKRLPNCPKFDPVRDDGDAAALAVAYKIKVTPRVGFVHAIGLLAPVNKWVAEWDYNNDGDPMKSYRLAVCRAVLKQAEALKW